LTKQDLENLNKKIDAMNVLLIRNDEKLIYIKAELEKGTRLFADHEARIRVVELTVNKLKGIAAVAGSAAGIITGIAMSFLKKILGG